MRPHPRVRLVAPTLRSFMLCPWAACKADPWVEGWWTGEDGVVWCAPAAGLQPWRNCFGVKNVRSLLSVSALSSEKYSENTGSKHMWNYCKAACRAWSFAAAVLGTALWAGGGAPAVPGLPLCHLGQGCHRGMEEKPWSLRQVAAFSRLMGRCNTLLLSPQHREKEIWEITH